MIGWRPTKAALASLRTAISDRSHKYDQRYSYTEAVAVPASVPRAEAARRRARAPPRPAPRAFFSSAICLLRALNSFFACSISKRAAGARQQPDQPAFEPSRADAPPDRPHLTATERPGPGPCRRGRRPHTCAAGSPAPPPGRRPCLRAGAGRIEDECTQVSRQCAPPPAA
jgi:hypothetical protein